MWWETNHYIGPVHVVLDMAMVAVHNHQTSCFSWVDADGVIPSCQVWQFWVDSITQRWSPWLKFWEQFCENRKKGFFRSICYIVAVRKLNLGQTLGFTRVIVSMRHLLVYRVKWSPMPLTRKPKREGQRSAE